MAARVEKYGEFANPIMMQVAEQWKSEGRSIWDNQEEFKNACVEAMNQAALEEPATIQEKELVETFQKDIPGYKAPTQEQRTFLQEQRKDTIDSLNRVYVEMALREEELYPLEQRKYLIPGENQVEELKKQGRLPTHQDVDRAERMVYDVLYGEVTPQEMSEAFAHKNDPNDRRYTELVERAVAKALQPEIKDLVCGNPSAAALRENWGTIYACATLGNEMTSLINSTKAFSDRTPEEQKQIDNEIADYMTASPTSLGRMSVASTPLAESVNVDDIVNQPYHVVSSLKARLDVIGDNLGDKVNANPRTEQEKKEAQIAKSRYNQIVALRASVEQISMGRSMQVGNALVDQLGYGWDSKSKYGMLQDATGKKYDMDEVNVALSKGEVLYAVKADGSEPPMPVFVSDPVNMTVYTGKDFQAAQAKGETIDWSIRRKIPEIPEPEKPGLFSRIWNSIHKTIYGKPSPAMREYEDKKARYDYMKSLRGEDPAVSKQTKEEPVKEEPEKKEPVKQTPVKQQPQVVAAKEPKNLNLKLRLQNACRNLANMDLQALDCQERCQMEMANLMACSSEMAMEREGELYSESRWNDVVDNTKNTLAAQQLTDTPEKRQALQQQAMEVNGDIRKMMRLADNVSADYVNKCDALERQATLATQQPVAQKTLTQSEPQMTGLGL